MNKKLSRRGFIKKGSAVMGAVVTCDLSEIIGAGRANVFKAFASEGLKENNMPHVSVKLWPGKSEETKQQLADAIVQDVVSIIGCGEESVSVAIEEVSSGEWKDKVYDPEIREKMEKLYKKPGYSM
jgi:4-oxalocrotonate tautomerase